MSALSLAVSKTQEKKKKHISAAVDEDYTR